MVSQKVLWRPFRVQQFVYVLCVCTPTLLGILDMLLWILDMHTLTRTLIFSLWLFKVSSFLNYFNFKLPKNLLLYIWPLIYLFVLGSTEMYYISLLEETDFLLFTSVLKKPYFSFFDTFFHVSLPQGTGQLRVSVRK